MCGWEDDNAQFADPTLAGGANELCLQEARRRFEVSRDQNDPRCREPASLPRYTWSGQWQIVQLGRDAAIRPSRISETGEKLFQCVCCGAFTLNSIDMCDICGDCGWEDWYECHDAPNDIVRPNYISLNDARSVFQRFGAAACCTVNARSATIQQIERMSPSELASLKTLREQCRSDQ